MRRRKNGESDRMMKTFSPIMDEGLTDIVVSGEMGVGRKGNPVTILVEDEVTGEVFEVNHAKSALLIIEDERGSGQGWLSLATGNVEKLSEVLKFLSKMTLTALKSMVGRN